VILTSCLERLRWSDGLEGSEVSRNRPTLFLEQLEDRTLLAVSFAPPVTFPVASEPNFVAVADPLAAR
jgi:hypothetical protein